MRPPAAIPERHLVARAQKIKLCEDKSTWAATSIPCNGRIYSNAQGTKYYPRIFDASFVADESLDACKTFAIKEKQNHIDWYPDKCGDCHEFNEQIHNCYASMKEDELCETDGVGPVDNKTLGLVSYSRDCSTPAGSQTICSGE